METAVHKTDKPNIPQPIEVARQETNKAALKHESVIDFVLVYDLRDEKHIDFRRAFEKAMLEEGLRLDYETFRGTVFMKITAQFQQLAKEAERVRLEMPLRGCEIVNPSRSLLTWIQKLFMTDDEVDFVSAPFQSDKLYLYEGFENQERFFRSSVRGFLVHHMLINLDISKKLPGANASKGQSKTEAEEETMHVQRAKEDVVNRMGLPYLLMNGAYTDAFVLHDPSAIDPYYARATHKTLEQPPQQRKERDDARAELDRTWTKFFKFQPLWKIRNYFGEKVAFYFAWQGTLITLLWIPAILGLAVFFYGVAVTVRTKPDRVCIEHMTGNWNNSSQACTWTSIKSISEDALDVIKKSFDNTYTPFFSLVICLWGALFLEVWKRNHATLSYQWDMDTFLEIEPDRPEFVGTIKQLDPITKKFIWTYPFSQQVKKFLVSATVVAVAVCIVFISVTAVILFKVSMKIVFNCSSAEDGDIDISHASRGVPKCLLMATVLPSVLNGISILLFGTLYTKLAERLTRWENHRTQSDYNNSLIIKLFAFQFVNTYSSLFYIAFFRSSGHAIQEGGILKLGDQYTDTCTRGSCMSLLSLQVLILMIFKPFPKFFMDIALPSMKRQFYRIKSHLQGYSGTVMQAVAFAAADQTWISDGAAMPDRYIQREYYKPPTGDFTLAEYSEKIIQFGYIMMFSASFPLAPLFALVVNLFDMRVDARRLLWFNRRAVAFMAADIGMWFPIMRFVTLCGVVSNAFIIAYTSSFCDEFFPRTFTSGPSGPELRLLVIIVFEHVVLICMYFISVVIPDVPQGIKLAQRRERYEVTKLLEEATAASHLSCPEKLAAAALLSEEKPQMAEAAVEKHPNGKAAVSGTPQGDPDSAGALNHNQQPTMKRRRAMVVIPRAVSIRSTATDNDSVIGQDCVNSLRHTAPESNDDAKGDVRKRSPNSRLRQEAHSEDFTAMPNSIGSPPASRGSSPEKR